MEEKKITKISLSTFFLILAIIIIIVMGIFMYKFYNEKIAETKKSTELQTQISNLNETVTDLQTKINTISNTIDTEDKVLIDGTFSEGATGHVYVFNTDGTVIEEDELQEKKGTYITTEKKQVKVVLTESTIVDTDTEEKNKENINETYKVTVIDTDTLRIEGQNDQGKYDFNVTRIK